MRVGCVIMASGLGQRFGSNKLVAPFLGQPMVRRIFRVTRGISNRVVVTRHADVAALAQEQGIPVVLHGLPYRSDTVRLGLEAVGDVDSCMFCPADQPLLREDSLQALLDAFQESPEQIHALSWQGQRGMPVLFPKWCFPELGQLPQGKGGNVLLKRYPQRVHLVQARDAGELQDADTPEMLRKLEELGAPLSRQMEIPRGITAILGGGGKTTLMLGLARELSRFGRVIVTTSTKIYPPEGIPICDSLETAAQAGEDLICVGIPAPEGKLRGLDVPVEALENLADFVLVEADGSKHLPFKAHGPTEPVIPPGTKRTILVVGCDAFGKTIGETVHRSQVMCARLKLRPEEHLTEAMAAELIRAEGFGDLIYLNKVETEEDWTRADRFRRALGRPILAGSLHKEDYRCLY